MLGPDDAADAINTDHSAGLDSLHLDTTAHAGTGSLTSQSDGSSFGVDNAGITVSKVSFQTAGTESKTSWQAGPGPTERSTASKPALSAFSAAAAAADMEAAPLPAAKLTPKKSVKKLLRQVLH